MILRRRWSLAFLPALLLLSACAKQAYPSGGPKDTTPPKVLTTTPQNGSRLFDAHSFSIAFDEYVNIKDADNNILISPPMKQKPEFSTKGKRVVVSIKDTLRPETTYLFQFKGAIVDFNEGNPLPSFEYVFSTGSRMDTLMLAGRVLSARDGKPWPETVTVAAYRADTALSDTCATHLQPDYVTRADKDGLFAFHYIAAGNYRLVAFQDNDRNLRLDPSEPSAWEPLPLSAADSIDSSHITLLRLSPTDQRKQRLLKSEMTAPGKAVLIGLLPFSAPSLITDSCVWSLSSSRDTLTLWLANRQADSVRIVLSDTNLQDTLSLRYKKPSSRSRRTSGPEPAERALTPLCDASHAFADSLMLRFSPPAAFVSDSLHIELLTLKDSSLHSLSATLLHEGLFAKIDTTLRPGEKYRIHIPAGMFTDVFGGKTDSLSFSLSPISFGSITLHVDNRSDTPLLIELLDNRDTVVQRLPLPSSSTIRFSHLRAGEYRLRAVFDTDSSLSWTPGDYRLQRQPESVEYYSKTLQVRDDWEIEERWTLRQPSSSNLPDNREASR